MFSQGMCPREWWWSEEVERNKQSLQLYILSSLTQTMLEPHTSDKCPLQLFCQQLKQEVPHTHTHTVSCCWIIVDDLWISLMIELKWFQLQRVTKGLPSSARITECCDLSEPCQSMVSSQVQRRLRRPGYRFYWGWAAVVGDEKGIPGRIEYDRIFPKRKPGFEIRQLGDHPQS